MGVDMCSVHCSCPDILEVCMFAGWEEGREGCCVGEMAATGIITYHLRRALLLRRVPPDILEIYMPVIMFVGLGTGGC